MTIALFSREIKRENLEVLKDLLVELSSKGAHLCYYKIFKDELDSMLGSLTPSGSTFSTTEDLPADTKLFLSLGGDGTFLTSITFVREKGIPLAGINFGRLGFLTTAKVSEGLSRCLDDLLNLNFATENRSLLKVDAPSMPKDFYQYAVNEVSIQGTKPIMLNIDISINGKKLPTYHSDGIVIATPTGSTAYSLSVGGPIVMPNSDVMIIAPIASHNLNMRPLVAPIDSYLEVVVSSRSQESILTVDNRMFNVANGEKIVITKGDYGFKYVSISENNFIDALRNKLLWGEDRRNSTNI